MPRQTVKVADVVRAANVRMGVPDAALDHLDKLTPQQAYRAGVASLVEHVLHLADTYQGFGYLESPYVAGQTDETRRAYAYVFPRPTR